MILFADGHSQNREWADHQVLNQAGNFTFCDLASGTFAWRLSIATAHG
jgi:hypothetical protein